MSNFTYGNIELACSKNQGILKPDSRGYYTINAGGFNMPNRMGITYRMNQYLLECLEEGPTVGSGSDLRRRLDRGEVMMEMNHPVQWFYEKIDGKIVRTQITDVLTWINRLKTIDMDRVCGVIEKFTPDFSKFDRRSMSGPVPFSMSTKPFGPFGDYFKESLDTPEMGTAVSIRTVTAPQQFGATARTVEYWTGVDWVPEPGFAEATKYRTDPRNVGGMESLMLGMGNVEEGITVDAGVAIQLMEASLGDRNRIQTVEGMESFNQMKDMVDTLKRNHRFSDTGKREIVVAVNPMDLF